MRRGWYGRPYYRRPWVRRRLWWGPRPLFWGPRPFFWRPWAIGLFGFLFLLLLFLSLLR